MFGSSIYVVQDSSHLVVIDPISYWSVFSGAFVLYPLWLFLTPKYFSKRKALLLACTALLWLCFTSITQLTLDRTTGTAHFEQFMFLHWSR